MTVSLFCRKLKNDPFGQNLPKYDPNMGISGPIHRFFKILVVKNVEIFNCFFFKNRKKIISGEKNPLFTILTYLMTSLCPHLKCQKRRFFTFFRVFRVEVEIFWFFAILKLARFWPKIVKIRSFWAFSGPIHRFFKILVVKNFEFFFFQKKEKNYFGRKNPLFTILTHLMTSLSPHLENFWNA